MQKKQKQIIIYGIEDVLSRENYFPQCPSKIHMDIF